MAKTKTATQKVPQVALVAMPWYSVWVPSVQLSVLRQCLSDIAEVDSYELYVDFAARISPQVYDPLSGGGEFVEEWMFAQHYFRGEGLDYESDVESFGFPPIGIGDPEKESELLLILADIAGSFLTDMTNTYDWGKYDVIGFTLGIAQTSASMALAARIKKKFPHVKILFGGSACLGPQGIAIMEICPYVDAIVQGEAEGIVEQVVQKLSSSEPLNDIPSVLWRDANGDIINNGELGQRFNFTRRSCPPNFDEYISRVQKNGLFEKQNIMFPFESSRGCWWGEKSQCTFCGLAEDMRYKARKADEVLEELDYLSDRYGINQFFATDLIMPVEYYKDLLPIVKNSDRDFWFYYELKANVRRSHVKLLSNLVHVQPGLESLSSKVLKLMKKGISATQNVQFLKWCQEYGVKIFSWHMIIGMPGETQKDLDEILASMPSLYHLQPPHFAYFELHRFSPIHRNPKEFGFKNLVPAQGYEKVFPVAPDILERFVYRFEYDSDLFGGKPPPWMREETAKDYGEDIRLAIETWQDKYNQGAKLLIKETDSGGILLDTRFPEQECETVLSTAELDLFSFLDTRKKMKKVSATFAVRHPEATETIGGMKSVDEILKTWRKNRWVYVENGDVVSLPNYEIPR